MDSSTKSSDRIAEIDVQKESDGTVSVTVFWRKYNHFEATFKDTSNRRWLRRQLKRITGNKDLTNVDIKQLDLFTDSTDVIFHYAEDAAQFILENS